MASPQNRLVVLGCSATKFEVDGQVPAVHLYDGPVFRVLRSRLRTHRWSKDLSIGILSAKYGLIGAVAPIKTYDQRMTSDRAAFLRARVTSSLMVLAEKHQRIHFVLGRDYLEAVDCSAIRERADLEYVDGGIGVKLHHFSNLLASFASTRRDLREVSRSINRGPLYFLPDWDDFLDVNFDFRKDKFSADNRSDREQAHSIKLMRPRKLCDGVLVSLAQHLGSKGMLRRLPPTDPELLRPSSVRDYFGLSTDQWAFGDCGAFSYSGQHSPAISVEQAVAVYELYDFDLGASVDHIPLPEIVTKNGKRRTLSNHERKRRVRLTRTNAADFMAVWKARGCTFTPVGIIQGIDAHAYANQVPQYIEMGYTHLALGGLVPRTDEDIRQVILEVSNALKPYRDRPWLHLLGVFRPKLQRLFRESGVSSFDSATYFRKAWLRSDQNYLGTNNEWYAALRVPPASDPLTLKRLKQSGEREATIKNLERDALSALRRYDAGRLNIDSCLAAVLRYDCLLGRGEFSSGSLVDKYRRTLEARPWKNCTCRVCKEIGIDVVIFRGYNRNKRRGAHNTLRLFESVTADGQRVHEVTSQVQ